MTDHQDLFSRAIRADDARKGSVEGLLQGADRAAPGFWEPGEGEEIWIPVEGAEIRVLHCVPPRPTARRSVVLVPGWGVIPAGYQDFYQSVRGKAEFYYIETREKGSSRIHGRRPDLSPSRSARDIGVALDALGLSGKRDFVLTGVCWGSTLILEGLREGVIDAPTVLVADPMHTLWFPKWLLRYVAPLAPSFLLGALRWLIVAALIGDMEEQTQKSRDYAFARAADPWKWKRSAQAARDLELFGALGGVRQEVFVLNGTNDKVHDQSHYPRIAHEIPRGRFLYRPTDESNRERCIGAAALEFARVAAAQ
ncbi:MAG: hypothetical protein IMZ69_01350, partial [Spirochaetes bacterium]|nr:hypothetical protein [Spirochaetota bacterium]